MACAAGAAVLVTAGPAVAVVAVPITDPGLDPILVAEVPAPPAITLVQSVGASPETAVTVPGVGGAPSTILYLQSATLPVGSTVHNLLVATYTRRGTTNCAPPTTPGGWTRAVYTCGGAGLTVLYYKPDTTAGVRSISFSSSTPGQAVQMSEWSGVSTVTPLGRIGTTTSAAASGATVTTTATAGVPGELALTQFLTGTTTAVASGSGWTRLHTDTSGTSSLFGDYQSGVSATGAAGESVSLASGTAAWSGVVATFKPADTTPPTAPTVTGGSASWRTSAVVFGAAGSSDAGGWGVSGYQYQTRIGAGAWSAATSGSSVAFTQEGQGEVRFRAVDAAGNTSDWAPAAGDAGMARVDITAPTAPTVAGSGSAWMSVDALTLTATGATDATSGVAGHRYRTNIDGGGWSAPVTGGALTVNAEGETLVQFQAIDAAGNASPWSATGTARIDRSPPGMPVITGGAETSGQWSAAASQTVAVAPAAGLTMEYRQAAGDGAWGDAVEGASVTVSDEGVTRVQFRARDEARNTSDWTDPVVVQLDRTAPAAPEVTGGSSDWTNVADITVEGVGEEGARLEHRVRPAGGEWGAVADGAAVRITAEGETQVQFRAVDAAGNASDWSATGVALIDTVAPGVPVFTTSGGGSAAWTAAAARTVAVGPVAGATIQYRSATGDGGWEGPEVGDTVSVSAEGESRVQFRAVDAADNASAWTDSALVRLDRTAPSAPAAAGGDTAWRSVDHITLTPAGAVDAAAGVTAYRYRVDTGDGWSAAADGASATVTAEGPARVQFQAVDAVGNASAWGTAGDARIDRTAPAAPGLAAVADPDVAHSSSLGRVRLTSTLPDDAVAVVITEGGRPVWDGAAGIRGDDGLSDGFTYVYRAVARDRAGNLSVATTASATTPDRTAPGVPSAPSGAGYPVGLAWDAVDGTPAVYEVRRDGVVVGTASGTSFADAGAVDAVAPPAPSGVQAYGAGAGRMSVEWPAVTDRASSYAVAVRALDAEGNAGEWSVPTTLLVRSGVARYRVLVDGVVAATTEATGVDLDGLEPGSAHTVQVVAVDGAGNASLASARLPVTLQTAAPRLAVRVSRLWTRSGEQVSLAAVVDGVAADQLAWRLGDGASARGQAVSHVYTRAGSYVVGVSAAGDDGTTSSAAVQVTVDDTRPSLTLTRSGSRVTVQADDAESGLERVEWTVTGGRVWTAVPADGIVLADGASQLAVRAVDRAGNVRLAGQDVTVDTVAPLLRVRTPVRAAGARVRVRVVATDPGSGVVALRVGTRRYGGLTPSVWIPVGRTVQVVAVDGLGNRSVATVRVRRLPRRATPSAGGAGRLRFVTVVGH